MIRKNRITGSKNEHVLDGDEVMGEGDPLYRAAHLGLEQWDNIPDGSRIRYSYSHDQSDIDRESAYSKVISFLFDFMTKHLTERQLEVIRMYHLDYNFTQDAIGQVLRISQPTVSQHIKGKKRNGKDIGGAYRKIRREISKLAQTKNLTTDERRIVNFLTSLSNSDTSFKQRRRLFSSLQ